MNKNQFKYIIKECIKSVLKENLENSDPLYVEYVKPMSGETPFVIKGEKFEYCWAKYPNGKVDIGVYAYSGDVCYGYNAFKQKYLLHEGENDFQGTDYEDVASQVVQDLKVVKKANLQHEYDALMNGIFKLPIQDFDKRSKQIFDLVNKAYKSIGNLNEIKIPTPKIRKSWGNLNPVSRIHGQGKQGIKPKYDRNREKNWKKDLDENDLDKIPNEDKLPGKFISPGELKLQGGVDPKLAKEMANKVWDIESSESGKNGIYNFKTRGQRYCCSVGMMNGQPVVVSKTPDFNVVNILTKDEIDRLYTENVNEMTSTGSVQGFLSKNWVDPDPKRKKMKNIASKSVGGKVT